MNTHVTINTKQKIHKHTNTFCIKTVLRIGPFGLILRQRGTPACSYSHRTENPAFYRVSLCPIRCIPSAEILSSRHNLNFLSVNRFKLCPPHSVVGWVYGWESCKPRSNFCLFESWLLRSRLLQSTIRLHAILEAVRSGKWVVTASIFFVLNNAI